MIKRTKYLIKAGLQFRYITTILLAVFLVAGVCVATTYYSLLLLLGEKLANVYPQGRLAVTLQNVNGIVMFRVLLLVPFVAVAGLILSHRIAGPVFRIENVLKTIGEGNLDVNVTLRKKDELKSLAKAVNYMTSNLKEDKVTQESLLRELSKAAGTIKELLRKEPLNKRLVEKKLDSIIQKIS